MRATKFKAWDIDGGHWIEEDQFYIYPNGTVHAWYEDEAIRNIELVQFTGTMDNNLKEIYEGDLLILNGDKLAMFEVFYHDDEARFKCCRTHYAGNRCGGYVPEMTSKNLTVIGNIYENKDLLV